MNPNNDPGYDHNGIPPVPGYSPEPSVIEPTNPRVDQFFGKPFISPNGQNPLPFVPPPKSSGPNKAFLAAVATVILVVTGGLIVGVLLARSNNGTVTDTATLNQVLPGTLDPSAVSSNRLDMSKAVSSVAAQDQDAYVTSGTQVDLNDGLSFKLDTVTRNYKSESELLKAAEGKELVAVTLTVGNRLAGENRYVDTSPFTLHLADGSVVAPIAVSDGGVAGLLEGRMLGPGMQSIGGIVYEINKDTALKSFEYLTIAQDATGTKAIRRHVSIDLASD